MKPYSPDLAEVRRTIGLILAPGQVTELRAIDASVKVGGWREGVYSGYFDNVDALAQAVTQIESAAGVYFIPNMIDPALLARACNRARLAGKKDPTTSDADITARRWLLIDADPIRPSGISASEQEHAAALARARAIRQDLAALGWPAPIPADSGNGAHLLYRVDLPAADDGLTERLLKALAARYDDALVKVDQSVFNPARIWKLYGTWARKGDSTPDRPHRLARILEAPDVIQAVDRALLTALAASAPVTTSPAQAQKRAYAGTMPFDLDAWITRYGLDVGDWKNWDGAGRRREFNACPFCDAPGKAYIGQRPGGAIAAGCLRDSCTWSWADLRAKYEPDHARHNGAAGRKEWASDPPAQAPAADDADASAKVAKALAHARETKDAAPIWAAAPALAALGAADYARVKADIKAALGKTVNLNDLDAAVREERTEGRRRRHTHTGLPVIVTTDRPLREQTEDAIAAILAADRQDPTLFVRAGALSRVRHDEKGRPLIQPVGEAELSNRLARVADFVRIIDGQERHIPPPDSVTVDLLALGAWPFPPLEAVVEVPTLRADGTILSKPGYDPQAGMIYAPAPRLAAATVAPKPGKAAVDAALGAIWDVFGEFPYAEGASKANTLALLLTPMIRPTMRGSVPLALIDAPAAGTGKSLLADIVAIVASGRRAPMMGAPDNKEEWRKQITASLGGGATFILIDNVEGTLYSPDLARALTAPIWDDRILGKSEKVYLPNRATWLATGNNIRLGGDLPRRCYWIRLDAKTARPWQREGFRHADIIGHAEANRGALVAALLTLARAWYAAGAPSPDNALPKLGGFEEWRHIVGGILQYAGVTGFLSNLEELYAQSDDDAPAWEAFLMAWHEAIKEPLTVADLTERIKGSEELRAALPGFLAEVHLPADETDPATGQVTKRSESGRFKHRLGNALARKADAYYGAYCLKQDGVARNKSKLWKVTGPNTRGDAETRGDNSLLNAGKLPPPSLRVVIRGGGGFGEEELETVSAGLRVSARGDLEEGEI